MSLKLNLHGAESFWKANSSPASKEMPFILWNSEVHYNVHKSLKIVHILIQINAAYVLPSCFHKIPFNIIPSSTLLSSKWLLLQVFPPSICMHICPMHVTGPTHLTHFNTLWTGDADLRLYITTVQDGWHKSAFLTRTWFPRTIHLNYAIHGAFLRMALLTVFGEYFLEISVHKNS